MIATIDQTKTMREGCIQDFPYNCGRSFFAQDTQDYKWLFVLQDRAKSYIVFDMLEPREWDDGRHVT